MKIELKFSPAIETELRDALRCYELKTHFDMCVELYKLGLLTEDELNERARHDMTCDS